MLGYHDHVVFPKLFKMSLEDSILVASIFSKIGTTYISGENSNKIQQSYLPASPVIYNNDQQGMIYLWVQ